MTAGYSALLPLSLTLAMPCAAQAVDPVAVGQIMTQRGTNEGYVDRARARAKGGSPARTVSRDCARAWKLHDRMNRQERRRLYDLCPR